MTQAALNSSPLQPVHLEAGARMTDFAGWSMPLRYTSDKAEHHAVRRHAGMFDLSHMGQIEVSGPQAADALDVSLVSAVSRLKIGRARYTMLVAPDGGILDDLIVYRLADQEFLVVANAVNRLTVLDEITRRGEGFQAAVVDRTPHRALIAVQGPEAARILGPLLPIQLDQVRYYSATLTEIDRVPVLLARTGYTGEDGFELSLPADSAIGVWHTIQEAGGADLHLCGLAARDSLRLEAGMPLYGQELGPGITPYEAGMGRLVHGDRRFVGAAALAERAAEDPRSHLVGLTGTGRRAARQGYRVLRDGDPVGTITSGALSPTLDHPIALARLDRRYPPGQMLQVDVRGNLQPMEVVDLPFYRRPD